MLMGLWALIWRRSSVKEWGVNVYMLTLHPWGVGTLCLVANDSFSFSAALDMMNRIRPLSMNCWLLSPPSTVSLSPHPLDLPWSVNLWNGRDRLCPNSVKMLGAAECCRRALLSVELTTACHPFQLDLLLITFFFSIFHVPPTPTLTSNNNVCLRVVLERGIRLAFVSMSN